LDPAPTGTGTLASDSTFGSFTLLEPVSQYENRFLWWKCLDWNRLFWCSKCGHGRSMYNILSIGKATCLWCLVFVSCSFVVMRSTKPGCLRSHSWCLWKALDKEGCMGFGSMTFGLVVQKFLNIEWFFHWKLN
jgi:hypothetical protein